MKRKDLASVLVTERTKAR